MLSIRLFVLYNIGTIYKQMINYKYGQKIQYINNHMTKYKSNKTSNLI